MKNIKILLIALSFNLSIIAQNNNYSGPAKMYVSNFYKQSSELNKALEKGNTNAAKTKLEQMEKSIEQTKTKDASYNTSSMEGEIKKAKDQLAKNADAENNAQKEKDKALLEANTYKGYSGPASKYVISFWEYAALPPDNMSENNLNIAIGNMKYSLDRTKEKDPTYNTSEMEAKLETYKKKKKELQIAEANKYTGDKVKDAQQNESISNDAGQLFEDLFEKENLQGGAGSVTGEKIKAKMEKYNQKATKLLSMDYSDAKIEHTRMSKGSINGMKMSTNREIDKVDVMLTKFTEKEGMEIGYYTMQFHMAYWDAAQKIFTEENSYKEMYDKVKASADKMGSLESMTAKAGTNNLEEIKNTKLPNPVVKDAALEKVLIDGFNKAFSTKSAIALKVVLTQDGWTTLRNSLTSVIVGRERSAKLAYKGSDGKCYLLDDYVFIHEEYIGGAFTNRKAVYNGLFGSEMLCENIK